MRAPEYITRADGAIGAPLTWTVLKDFFWDHGGGASNQHVLRSDFRVNASYFRRIEESATRRVLCMCALRSYAGSKDPGGWRSATAYYCYRSTPFHFSLAWTPHLPLHGPRCWCRLFWPCSILSLW